MKKLVLASLLGAFAISGANAAVGDYGEWRVRMDSNPLYRPMEGRFYSITNLDTNTDFDLYSLGEELGFGLSNRWSIFLNTHGSLDTDYHNIQKDLNGVNLDDEGRNKYQWDDLAIGLSFRFIDNGPWVADIYGKAQQKYDNADKFETRAYNWTLGAKFGFIGWDRWTLAFSAQADYLKDDLADADFDAWGMDIGVDALLNFNQHWNVVAGLHYDFNIQKSDEYTYYVDNPLVVKLGFDWNFNDWTYLGVYAYKDVKQDFDDAPMGLGVKFGVDF